MPEHDEAPGGGARQATDAHDCTETLRRLYYFLDGELDDQARSLIGEHLACCSHCLEAFEFEFELKAAVRQCCSEEVPPDLLGRIRAAIESDRGSHPA